MPKNKYVMQEYKKSLKVFEGSDKFHRLSKKLEIYRARVNPYGAPESQPHQLMAVFILNKLLTDKVIDFDTTYDEAYESYGKVIEYPFASRWDVIALYVLDELGIDLEEN